MFTSPCGVSQPRFAGAVGQLLATARAWVGQAAVGLPASFRGLVEAVGWVSCRVLVEAVCCLRAGRASVGRPCAGLALGRLGGGEGRPNVGPTSSQCRPGEQMGILAPKWGYLPPNVDTCPQM